MLAQVVGLHLVKDLIMTTLQPGNLTTRATGVRVGGWLF